MYIFKSNIYFGSWASVFVDKYLSSIPINLWKI